MSTIKCFKEVQTLKEIEGKEMFTFSEVLEKVDLSESALRKYVSLIDKQSPDGKYFYRNKKNHRLYSLTDIALLQQLVVLKSTGITLDNAINQALFSMGYSSVTVEDTEEAVSGVTLQSIMSVVYKQVEIMEKQANNIERLETLVEKLLTAEEEKNKQLDTPADNKTKIEFVDPSEPVMKKGIFSRLFNKKE
uniref:MerR family transcriptional regulator n=1 Tax=Carnobacterium alterfunditum TaxID=28230 RepID=UPI003450C0B4